MKATKKFLPAILVMVLLIIFAACGRTGEAERQTEPPAYTPEFTPPEATPLPTPTPLPEPTPEPTPEPIALTFELSIPLDKAAAYLAELDAVWDADGGELWGIPLHVPFMIVDHITRHAVANRPVSTFTRVGNVYVGILPTFLNLTASFGSFDMQQWGLMTWDFIETMNHDLTDVIQTMAHSAFHAIQSRVISGTPAVGSRDRDHMLELNPRINVMLETNALLTALRTTGDERLAAIKDALSIRAYRRMQIGSYSIIYENRFEMLEGTAVFTDLMLVYDNIYDMLAWVEDLANWYAGTTRLTNHGYFTGALYCFLLEEVGADWKSGLAFDTDLAALLKEALNIHSLPSFDSINLELYGYSEVVATESAFVADFARIRQSAYRSFTTLPTLQLDGEAELDALSNPDFFFNSFFLSINDVYRHVIHGNFINNGTWGRIQFTDGYTHSVFAIGVQQGIVISAVDMEIDGNRITAPTWELTLNDGFEIRPLADGNYRVVRG